MEGTVMPDGVTRLRIFVASPGDVLDERERLRLVVDELNRTLADSLGERSLHLLDWHDVVPSMGRPEQVILDQLKLDAWDIFVGILWTCFGSPPRAIHPETGKPFLSGTEEEFILAHRSWKETERPRILFYRCMRPPQLDKLDASQFQRVQQFFARFEAGGEHPGLYQSYKTLEEFERRVRIDLMRLILRYGKQLPDERQTALRTAISKPHNLLDAPIGIPGPKTKKVTIELDLEHFDERNQRWLQYGLAGFLEISPNVVRITSIEKSSVKVTIELPTQSAERLLSAYKRNDSELVKYLAPLVLLDLREATGREWIPVTKPPDFIDRKEEIELFEKMLAGNTLERVLALIIKPQRGKTYLMHCFQELCWQRQIPAALVDFDTRQREVVYYRKFVRQVCDDLGSDNFPEVAACEQQLHADFPMVPIQTGPGQAGTHFGTKGHFEEADLDRISGRDQVQIGDMTYFGPQDQAAARQEKLMYEMGRAFQSGLARMCGQDRVVLLLDTYEHAHKETRNWINEWVLNHLADRYPNLIVVIAGRPELYSYFDQPRPWASLMHLREELSHPEEGDIRKFFAEIQDIVIPDHLIPYAVKYARYKISILADMAKAHARYPNE